MIEMVGQRFGRLTVVFERSGRSAGRMCSCTCSCGEQRWVRAVELRRQKYPTRSCRGKHACPICGKMLGPQAEWSHARVHDQGLRRRRE